MVWLELWIGTLTKTDKVQAQKEILPNKQP